MERGHGREADKAQSSKSTSSTDLSLQHIVCFGTEDQSNGTPRLSNGRVPLVHEMAKGGAYGFGFLTVAGGRGGHMPESATSPQRGRVHGRDAPFLSMEMVPGIQHTSAHSSRIRYNGRILQHRQEVE
jgi:hypothetical protein